MNTDMKTPLTPEPPEEPRYRLPSGNWASRAEAERMFPDAQWREVTTLTDERRKFVMVEEPTSYP